MTTKQVHQKPSAGQRSLRCIIIGAGVSGILMAYKLREAFGDRVDFQIFEKNSDVGGTWLENRYPGCACDVPSHIYQFSFCPNPYWSRFYASSSEIQSYLKAVVFHYRLDQYIHFNSKVTEAVWHEYSSQWSVAVDGKGKFDCEVLVNAGGILNNPNFPNLRNLNIFQGQLAHTAVWDRSIDVKNKRVAIIGAGASAIQVLPEIQSEASHVDIYIRTPSWISPPTGAQFNSEHNHVYSEQEIAEFREDAGYSLQTRKDMETSFNCMYRAFFKDSDEQRKMQTKLKTRMRELIHSEQLQEKLIPSFEVGCRRINPGERYLAVLQKRNVEPIFSGIQEVTPDGIRDTDGKDRNVDIIIAATGFDTSFRPRFPIVGEKGTDLRDLWETDPISYCGLAVSGFPNYLIFLGPNTPIANGSLIGALEATGDYFVRLIRKVLTQRVSSFNVRADVQSDFNKHTQDFMQRMVWTGSCRSWFKNADGKVTVVWPGSGLHYREFLQSDRWEDWEWRYDSNHFDYWGLGFSEVETTGTEKDRDWSYYIEPHPNLPREALEMVQKQTNAVLKDDEGDSDASSSEPALKKLRSAETDSCETSETSWDDEQDSMKAAEQLTGTGEDNKRGVSLSQVAAFSA